MDHAPSQPPQPLLLGLGLLRYKLITALTHCDPSFSLPVILHCPALSCADATKFIAGAMQALSAMVKLELPHVNVLTKMDICPDKVWAHTVCDMSLRCQSTATK